MADSASQGLQHLDSSIVADDVAMQEQMPASDAVTTEPDLGEEEGDEDEDEEQSGKQQPMQIISANKSINVKKRDGEPLLRRDIQYDLLEYIFSDDKPVFTHKGEKLTFGEAYIRSLASSSKAPKTLRERMTTDTRMAVSVCKIGLLVNVGKLNTTLVFTPTQTRTFHSVPSLQLYSDEAKNLQDAPRLKTILKGACEDRTFPTTYATLPAKNGDSRPINAVALLFILSQANFEVSTDHFHPGQEFFDIFSKASYSSASRARAFLALAYMLLETNGTAEQALSNPYRDVNDDNPLRVPELVSITQDEEALENVDTSAELEYGDRMLAERLAFLRMALPARLEGGRIAKVGDPTGGEEGPQQDMTGRFRPLRQSGRKRRKAFVDAMLYVGSSDDEIFGDAANTTKRQRSAGTAQGSMAATPRGPTKRLNRLMQKLLEKDLDAAAERRMKQGSIQRAWERYRNFNQDEDSDIEAAAPGLDGIEECTFIMRSLRRAHRRLRKPEPDAAYGNEVDEEEDEAGGDMIGEGADTDRTMSDGDEGNVKTNAARRRSFANGSAAKENGHVPHAHDMQEADEAKSEQSSVAAGQTGGKTLPGLSALGYSF